MPNAGYASLQVIPSVKGAEGAMARGMMPAATTVGRKAGARAGRGFKARFAASAAKAGAIGKVMSKVVTLPLIGIGVAAVKSADSVGDAMDSIKIATGATGKKLSGLQGVAKAVARHVPASISDVSSAVGSLNTQTGATGPVLKKLTTGVLEASRVMGEDGAKNAKTFGRMLNQANIPAKKGSGLLKTLYAASQKYGTSLGGMMKNLEKFGPQLQTAGFSMKDTITLFGKFNKAGVDARRIVPSLNTAFLKWAKAGKDPKKMLVQLSEKIKNAKTKQEAMTAASQVFSGPGASSFVQAIRKGGVSLKGLSGDLDTSRVNIKKTGKSTRTFGENMSVLKNNAELALAPLGNVLLPLVTKAIRNVIPPITKAAKWFSHLSGSTQKWVMIGAGVLAIMGPMLSLFSKLVSVGARAFGAFQQLGSGLAKVGRGFKSLKKLALVTRVRLAALKAQTVATAVAQKVAAAGAKAYAIAQRLVNAAMRANPIGLIITGLTLLVAGLVLAYKKSATFRKIVHAAMAAVKKIASSVLGWFTRRFVPFFTKTIPHAFHVVVGWVKKHWPLILSLLTGPIGAAAIYIFRHWKKIKGYFQAGWRWIHKRVLNPMIHFFTKTIPHALGRLVGAVRSGWNKITGKFRSAWRTVHRHVINPIIRFFSRTVPHAWHVLVSDIRRGWDKTVGIFSSAWGRVKRILSRLKSNIVGWASSAIRWLKSAGRNIINGMLDGLRALRHKPVELLRKLGRAERKVFSRAIHWLKSAGKNLITGMLRGVRAGMRGIKNWLRDHVWRPIVHGVKSLFGISSPSKVFQGFGFQMIRGLIKGLIKGNAGKFIHKVFGGVSGSAGKALSWLVGHGKVALGKLGDIASGAWSKIKGVFGGIFGGGGAGAGVKKYTPQVLRALAMLGQPKSLLPAVLHRMRQESGGNKRAINRWDINAKRGTPSKGLMQVIGPTFARWAGKFRHLGIWNPFANIFAGLNYALHAYPSLRYAMLKPGGYAKGTKDASRGWHWVGENGPELMRFKGGEQVRSNQDSLAGGIRIDNITIDVDDLARLSTVADFVDMLKRERVTRRQTERSGVVTA